MYRIGIDVGGTFTDLVAVDPTGRATLAKVASTPEDPSIAVMAGLARARRGHPRPFRDCGCCKKWMPDTRLHKAGHDAGTS